MFTCWYSCNPSVLLPLSLCRMGDSEAPANRRMLIVSVVMGNYKKKKKKIDDFLISRLKTYKTRRNMNRNITTICILLFVISSCRLTENKKESIANDKDFIEKSAEEIIPETIDFKTILSSETADTSKLFEIKSDGIFFIQLTDAECDSMEKADRQAYESFSENVNNASMSAGELLTNMKIKQYWSNKRFIKFESNGKEYFIDTRKNENVRMGGCILFKKATKPMIIETELLTEELVNNYYKK